MDTDQAREIIIPVSSQEFLREAVNTFPLLPFKTTISLSLHTGEQKMEDSYNNPEPYVEKCRERNIIPYSTLHLRYDSEHKTIVPTDPPVIIERPRNLSASVQQLMTAEMLKGGRYEEVKFTSDHYGGEGFLAFRENYLGELSGTTYGISEFDFHVELDAEENYGTNPQYAQVLYSDYMNESGIRIFRNQRDLEESSTWSVLEDWKKVLHGQLILPQYTIFPI